MTYWSDSAVRLGGGVFISNLEVQRPVIRYFGGKWILSPWIISHFPKHRIYVEPFGGAASVLMRKPRSYAEIYNDLDQDVVNLFRVLRDDGQSLERVLRQTPFARDEFDQAYAEDNNPLEKARRLVIRAYMGFGSNGHTFNRTGFRANANRSGTTPAHDWASYPNHMKSITERLSGVVIENRDFERVLRDHDSLDTLHYVDPPYVHETRRGNRYTHEMNSLDHDRLLSCLKSLKGMVVLSGYDHASYSALGWKTVQKEAMADGARKRVETLWFNEAAWTSQDQLCLNVED